MHLVKRTILPIAAGLIIAQCIATGFVHLSNLDVHDMVIEARQSGFFAIPHGRAAAALTGWGAAVWGGLFYTLSIGVGLALAAWAAWHVRAIAFARNKYAGLLLLGLWAILIIAANTDGPTLFPTLFCFGVPLATWGCLYFFHSVAPVPDRHTWIIPAVALGLLTAIWATQLNQNLFVTIRDHLLLSNPAGRAVNDFYYRYTLFAAQSFKSVYQKTLRTCHLSADLDHRTAEMVKARLLGSDVLPLPGLRNPDMRVGVTKSSIVLTDRHGRTVESDLKQFLKAPHELLRSFSAAADRYGPLRRMTLYGLMFGFPILLFIIVYAAFRTALGLLLHRGFGWSNRNTTLAAAALCLMSGIGLFLPIQAGVAPPLSADNLAQALGADTWQHRVAALRQAEQEGLDLADYPQYRALVHSPLPVERYWLARALAAGRNPATYADLLSLIADHHPNVQCQVYYALGKRGDRSTIQTIKTQILASSHWYAQWYGYRAMRRLGWHQGRSKE